MRDRIKLLTMSLLTGMTVLFGNVSAQQDTSRLIDNAIETLETQLEDLADAEAVTEDLLERMEDVRTGARQNLNDLSYEAAVMILQLTDYQYYQLQLYIENHGRLYSVYEIPAIEGFSDEDLRRLADKVVIAPPPKTRPTFRELARSGKSAAMIEEPSSGGRGMMLKNRRTKLM